MNFDKVRLINHYIIKKRTGKADEFATKINISRGMLYRYINYMKTELNAPIIYNRIKNTYQYNNDGKLYVNGWEK